MDKKVFDSADPSDGIFITSLITVEAAKELKLKKGDEAYAIIKGPRKSLSAKNNERQSPKSNI